MRDMKSGGLNHQDVVVINSLLRQLSRNIVPLSVDEIRELCQQKNFQLMLLRDSSKKRRPIIGMASIYFEKTLTGTKGYIEDVVVNARYRGQGLGKKIIQRLIEFAKEKGAKHIDLTSNPARVAANAMYQKLGFIKRKTNVYRFVITP